MMPAASIPFEERYELREPLWADGPYAGWLAHDWLLAREVQVNLQHSLDCGRSFVQRARMRARLRHAQLAPIYDLGSTKEGTSFFTEPYIQALDLAEILRDGDKQTNDPITLRRLVTYLLDACKAIAFIHENGCLHLELRPSHIKVIPPTHEVFVVLPWDIEKSMLGAEPTFGFWGAPGYMAPEQPKSNGLEEVDARADVYGLGGILFEILYGSPPNGVESDMKETVTALIARTGPPRAGRLGKLAARNRELARGLAPICLRSLDSDPQARPKSVAAFSRELERCIWGSAR